MSVKTLTLKISKTMDLKDLALQIQEVYKNNDNVRMILDTKGSDITKESIMKFKKVFDKFEDQAKEKLQETIIVVDSKLKKILLQTCIQFFKTNGTVKIIQK